ncbi:MAG: hypothetical protein FE78DRAFT_39963 [Acidomyces sp. 'richmondensis']|nr:MAG: hypothetical protein FE78DRAFT_39963 [Acidomyces sp. 'richmondensis']
MKGAVEDAVGREGQVVDGVVDGVHHLVGLVRMGGKTAKSAVSRFASRAFNDRHATHDRYTTSLILQQRQEQASAYDQRAGLHEHSRPSSSSGSTHSPGGEAQYDDLRASRPRARSVDGADRKAHVPEESSRREQSQISHRRVTSASYPVQSPHPALRISRRTRAAILFTLEEAIRYPNSFTPDLEEENAQMSDLGGRATNGGARTGGPVPVSSGAPSGIRTPRDVMRERNAREQRRQEEQKAEEARRLAEDRRRSAERRTAAIGGAGSRLGQAASQYGSDTSVPQGGYDGARGTTGRVSGADVLGEPVSRTQEYPSARSRGPSVSQPDQPRVSQPIAGGARRTQQSQAAPRQPASQISAATSSSQAQQPLGEPRATTTTTTSFPHAFERWETLSAHWEGLTSYWLHKLEQNTEEIRNTVPNASTLSRQITDLSAAGANLFHAVVELQRLRASSERKFQRWFFETRADTERNAEAQAQSERQLRLERSAREEAVAKRAEAEEANAIAKREVNEMRRELMISKEEARRAWEELGRRNQEALDTAENLKSGRIAVVAGVQVVPYFGGPSRSGTGASQRPATRDGQVQYGSVAGASSSGAAGLASPGDDREYYRERPSPTNTDPFTEQQQPPEHQGPEQTSSAAATYQPYPPTTSGSTPSRAQPTSTRTGQVGATVPSTTQEDQRLYQHAPAETFLHSPRSSSAAVGQAPASRREDIHSEASYVESEGDTEYAIDAAGGIKHDERGRPIILRRPGGGDMQGSENPDEALRDERELAARYGRSFSGQSQVPPEAPTVPATSAQAMATYAPTAGSGPQPSRPDYEGSDYMGWEALQTRHHHPTRLSDVLEEEEERSSRRTGDQ